MSAAIVTGLAVVTVLLSVLVLALLRSHAEILRALHDLGVNLDPTAGDDGRRTIAPQAPRRDHALPADITGSRPGGGPVHVAVGGRRHRTLLAFLSSTCLTCRGFWDVLGDPTIEIPGRARLVVVVRDPDVESPSALAKLMAPHVVTVHSTEAWDAYDVPGAPFFVLVDGPTNRILGAGTATTWEHVRDLMHQALGDAMHLSQADREAVVDATLRAAGVEPGDPSLYPEAQA